MKILFCTNAFETVSNGPARFAHLVLQMNQYHPDCEIRILTEDCTNAADNKVYKLHLRIPAWLKPLGQFIRMAQYHKQAMYIKKKHFAFDYLIYNNAIVGIWSGLRYNKTIGFINDDTYAGISWKNFWGLNWSRKHVFYLVEKFACKTIPTIIVNSNYLRNTLISRYGVNEKKIFRLYKAIDFPVAMPVKSNTVPIILFVKNDYLRGGLFNLIDALKSLSKPLRLIIAGPHQHAKESIFKYLGTNHQLDVEFKGIISPSEVYDLMRRADIFCVPSNKEALGVANLEAMAMGCSIISTNTGGIPEVLNNGANGWLVSPDNVEELANAIKEALENPEIRALKIKNGHIFVEQFSLGNVLSNFKSILLNLDQTPARA